MLPPRMNEAAVIRCSYSDFRFVKSRGVAQIVLEIDIAKADAFLAMFKAPQPGHERPVAVALLAPGSSNGRTSDFESDNGGSTPSPGTTPPAATDKLVQRVAILCGEAQFRDWLNETFPNVYGIVLGTEDAARFIRCHCRVTSRRELSTNPEARKRAEALLLRYDQAMGRVAMDWRSA